MNLHEYQAKQLFAQYDLPIPKGITIDTVEEACTAMDVLNTQRCVVKAQIHAGGRGKAGGIRKVESKAQLETVAQNLLHARLATHQTDPHGYPIHQLLIEEICTPVRELYFGITIDRTLQRMIMITSTEGGMGIEQIAEKFPEKIFKTVINPLVGIMPYQCRELALALAFNESQSKQLAALLTGAGKMFIECDLTLLEINPLIITEAGHLLCLDAKVVIDDNALYRQHKLRALHDPEQEDIRERTARAWELNYIALEGDIGCMVNGAGLAMATLDLIKLQGGNPANFLDVGGGVTHQRVKEAFKIIISDTRIKTILVNIFGGIVRCDLIAQGIIEAITEIGIQIPIVVRLEGNSAVAAIELLTQSGLNIISASSLLEAAKRVVQEARNLS